MILQKISKSSIGRFEKAVRRMCAGLRVEFADFITVTNGWVKTKITGEDEKAALSLIGKEIGLAPVSLGNITRFSVCLGRVVFSGKSEKELFVDVGVFLPDSVFASIPLNRIQGQLVDGGEYSLNEISEMYGLVDGIPLEVRVVKVKATGFEAELTQGQIRLFRRWISYSLDRLIVLGSTSDEVIDAVRNARFANSVATVVALGIMDQLVVCRLGTDAAGLVRELGRYLRNSSLVCFSPRGIQRLV